MAYIALFGLKFAGKNIIETQIMSRFVQYIFLSLLLSCVCVAAWGEYNHPSIISFEESVAPVEASRGGRVRTTEAHYKHGKQSLQWTWNREGAYLSIKQPIDYEYVKTVNTDNSVYTFVFWMYLEKPLTDSLRFEFWKEGRRCCWFAYGTDFTGWRGAWVGFKRDMQGQAEEGMDELRIYAPAGQKRGTVWLDHVILSSLQDVRHHTADLQAPYVNKRSESHWLVLLKSWQQAFDIALPEVVTDEERSDMATIEARMDQSLLPGRQKVVAYDKLVAEYATYGLEEGAGLPIFFERYGETYEHWDRSTSYTEKIGDMGLRRINQLLMDLAVAYRHEVDAARKEELGRMFITLTRHITDQGFQAGSGLGTLHHLGYSMRLYYPAMYLMRDKLREAGLAETIQQSMEWFSGVGEVKVAPKVAGMDIDAFNTSLEGRLMSILLIGDARERVRYLSAFSRWVDNGYRYADGLAGSFKPDGTIFHHCNHYPAYAVGGLTGAVNALYLLHGTSWAVSRESHEHLKEGLLAMRTYCNLLTWPLSLSGRHPDGKGHLMPSHYGLLSICGSPDGTEPVDRELAGAYLRLTRDKGDTSSKLPVRQYRREYQAAGITEAEAAPNGSWSYPYSCLQVQRRGEWLLAIKGHSRYIWNTETYEGCNLYGRYLNYGNIQILGSGDPISNAGSGFRMDGWDWAHIPGTTATVVPVDSLAARINNLDVNSGFEEMLQSDEAFCNGLSLLGQGIWGMKLHSHDKYDGTLYARKSVFCFDNRVICLGTNIRSGYAAPTETTLFQTAVPVAEDVAIEKDGILSDGYGNYYYSYGPDTVYWREGRQESRHEETGAKTEGLYRMAAVAHGVMPEDGRYEYVAVVQPDTVLSREAIAGMYEVLRADSMGHVVRDKASGMTGFVLFEAGAALGNSAPCLVVAQPSESGLTLCVSDPDLHLYEGPSDETYDAEGKRKERIIYSYAWKDSPSRESEVSLRIPGRWTTDTEGVRTTVEGDETVVTVRCQHGMGRTMALVRL